jgi:GTPase KRas protein
MNEYKIVIIGSGGVGKSAICIQFITSHFIEEYDPTIEDSYIKQITIDDEEIILDILDTAGQEEYTSMRDYYMRSGQGFILVYSITNDITFHEISSLRDQILRAKDKDIIPMILVGNKSDLESQRKIQTLEGITLSKNFGIPFFETSAKLKENITEIFCELVREIKKQECPKKLYKKRKYIKNFKSKCKII